MSILGWVPTLCQASLQVGDVIVQTAACTVRDNI